MFEIDGQTFTCTKRDFRTHYQPIGLPQDALYVLTYIIGTLSVPKAGVSVEAWEGYTPRRGAMSTLE